jgi:hypothetical protein
MKFRYFRPIGLSGGLINSVKSHTRKMVQTKLYLVLKDGQV